MANHSSILAKRPHEKYKKAKRYDTRRWAPRSDIQYATREEWKAITNSSKKNEEAEPKWKRHSPVDVSGRESPML